MIEIFFSAFSPILAFQPLFFILAGVILGIVLGATPGLTGAMGIALMLPLTFYMDSKMALILLVSIYVGAISGGLLPATLLRIPGTPASIMTTYDGYPMAKGGRPGRALGFGITASFIGGLISWLFLALLSPPLAQFALRFGPFEYFSMTLMAFVLIAAVTEGSILLGLLSAFFGLVAAMPGLDPVSAELRLSFGVMQMAGGFETLPVLIGLFAVSQILLDTKDIGSVTEKVLSGYQGMFMTLAEWRQQAFNLIRSSVIGTWIGVVPGIGANVGSIVAYTLTKSSSKTPEKFGTGFEDGIVASEAANNATVAGALIPLITMGIPGSVVDAILLGALVIHNIQPGPLLFRNEPDLVFGMIWAVLIANVMMFVIMMAGIGWLSKLANVSKSLLNPVIVVLCCIGTYAANNRHSDLWVMLTFGIIGYVLQRCKVPLGPFVIAYILAPLLEKSIRSGLMMSAGSLEPLFTRPISAVFLAVSLVTLAYAINSERRTLHRLRTVSTDKEAQD